MDLLYSPQQEETLMSLLDQSQGVEGPREVPGDVDTQKLEAADTVLRPFGRDGVCVPSFDFL